MNWVSYDEDLQWSQLDLRTLARSVLRGEFPDAQDLQVKASQLATGSGFMTAPERQRWDAYVSRKSELEEQADAEWLRMQLLEAAMAVEVLQRRLYSLPDDEESAAERAALQAQISGASPEIAALVAQRGRNRPPEEEEGGAP